MRPSHLACLLAALLATGCDDGGDAAPGPTLTFDGSVDAALDAARDATPRDMPSADAAPPADDGAIPADATAEPPPDAGAEPEPPPDAGPALSEIERVRAGFGRMFTVAGRGQIPEKSENGWRAAYEGGDAIDAELSRPHMTMADAAGNLYIADKDAHAIRKVATDGRITTLAGTSVAGDDGDTGVAAQMRLNAPNGLWAQPDGTVFVLDLGNRAVRQVDPDGQMTTLFRDPAGFGTGRGLWVAPDASLVYYAAGSAVRRWDPENGIQPVVGGFASLGNLVVDLDGDLIVTDRLGHRVHRIVDGVATPIAGNGTPDGGGDGRPALETGLDEVRGVWPHPAGGYLLATHEGGQVWYLDTSGVIHLLIDGDDDRDTHAGDGEPLDTPGRKLSEVRAVTMAPDGALIITEHDAGYIRRVEPR